MSMRQGKVLDTMHAPYAGTGMQSGYPLAVVGDRLWHPCVERRNTDAKGEVALFVSRSLPGEPPVLVGEHGEPLGLAHVLQYEFVEVHVLPRAEFAPDFPRLADVPEAERDVQPCARLVASGNAGEHRMKAPGGGSSQGLPHEFPADALSVKGGIHVDGRLNGKAIGGFGAVR